MTRPSGKIDRPVDSLAELQLSGQTLDKIIGHIGTVAVNTLSGWDAAAASLIERDKVATYGTNDERVNPVDQAQYDSGKGPCVDAMKTGEVKYFDGNEVPPQWRHFAEAAADADVYSVVSFPLKLNDEVMGALNFYSREREALRPGQREEALLFSSHAAVTIANAKALVDADAKLNQLEDALRTRTIIGQATGLLMAQDGLSSEEAFQKLVKVSQNANLKLREIAQRYVETWQEKVGQGRP